MWLVAAAASLTSACSGTTAVTPTPTSSSPAVTSSASVVPGAPYHWIVYQPAREEGLRIARTDGGGAYYQVDGPAGVLTNPDWSPDGSSVIFAVQRGGSSAAWQADADGGNARPLLECAAPCQGIFDPSFSPSGSEIAVAAMDRTGAATIDIYQPATGHRRMIATPARNDFFAQPRYAPGGDRLVAELFHRDGGREGSPVTGSSLVIVDLATGTAGRPLTDPLLLAEHSDWGDGGLIVFDQRLKPSSDTTDVFTIKPDGSGLTRLTRFADTGGSAGQPSWTPDGRVLFTVQSTPTAEYTLMTIDLTGRHLTPAIDGRTVAGVHARMAARN
ncbi:hypothetical protein GCM10009826_13730 [Humibacillus xanthopallidus]|uniref:TolB family protein n=1 Tax=Humibacillus xanthopallidus TaxID=412689 RepID=UPI00163A6696|nr:PD40 domain-containing protein [Humibacillus xanthopallidus]